MSWFPPDNQSIANKYKIYNIMVSYVILFINIICLGLPNFCLCLFLSGQITFHPILTGQIQTVFFLFDFWGGLGLSQFISKHQKTNPTTIERAVTNKWMWIVAQSWFGLRYLQQIPNAFLWGFIWFRNLDACLLQSKTNYKMTQNKKSGAEIKGQWLGIEIRNKNKDESMDFN